MDYRVISFYRYKNIKDPLKLRDSVRDKCEKLNILGRILLAKEGINCAVCGKNKDIEKFKEFLDKLFKNLTYREQKINKQVYHKLVTRVKNEIVHFGEKVDLNKTGNHLEPEEFKKLLDKNENLVIIDARNEYEYKVGRFKDAINLKLIKFRDFPKKVKNLEKYKDKKIVMYCTGGVRCEKASSYLIENEFKDVNQLKGGIINYVNEYPNDNFEGSCFVFDDRLTSKGNNILTKCLLCNEKSDDYVDCHNMDCDKLFISCKDCQEKLKKTCSLECLNNGRLRPEKKKIEILGIVTNYFRKSKIAEVRLKETININKIGIIGKTSNFEQEINGIMEHGNNIITFPVDERVRVNDKVVLI